MAQRNDSFRENLRLGYRAGKERIGLAEDLRYLKDPRGVEGFIGIARMLDFNLVPGLNSSTYGSSKKETYRRFAQRAGLVLANIRNYSPRRPIKNFDRYVAGRVSRAA